MKKIFIIFILLFVGQLIYGQENLGFKLGLNVCNVNNSTGNDFTILPNFNTGAVAKFKLHDKFMLTSEVLFSIKGFYSMLIPSGSTSTSLSYLSLPTIIEYQPSKKIYFQIGPEFNFLLNARMKNKSFDASVIDNYKKFDLAIVGGLGFKLFKGLNIETRYSLGLSQIRQNETIFGAYKTRTFQINLVYLLKLKK